MNILDTLTVPSRVEIRFVLFNYRTNTKAARILERLEMELEVRRAINA